MRRLLCVTLLLAMPLIAQDAPAPEQCLADADARDAVTVTHGGKEYRLATESCREQFLSDPERYAQLYDALGELEASGIALPPPRSASLVPS